MRTSFRVATIILVVIVVAGCGLFQSAEHRAIRERIAIESNQADTFIGGGWDIKFYSDTVRSSETGSIDSAAGNVQFDGTLSIGGVATFAGSIDLDGAELTLDADADTSITADTDDQVDFEIGAADEYTMTASGMYFQGNELVLDADADSSLTVSTDDQLDIELNSTDEYTLTATAMYFQANSLVLDADIDTSITADTDDQIDIELNGSDDFQFTINTFTALSGSAIEANTINETTGGSGVNVDSVLLKDGSADLTLGPLTLQNDEGIGNATNGEIDFLISGNREFTFTSTSMEIWANELFLDADADTSLHSDVDDQIDFTLGGQVDAVFAANLFQLSTGTVLEVDVVNEETADAGVTVEGVLLKDGEVVSTGAITVAFGSILYVSDIIEASADEGVNIEGSSLIDSNIIAGAALTTTTFMEIGTWLRPSLQSTIVVTNGGTITPTGTYQPISAVAAVGLDDIVIMSDGDVLVLTNVDSNTVTITDTGVIMLSGNIALGEYDTLTLLCDGTNWIQIATSNN